MALHQEPGRQVILSAPGPLTFSKTTVIRYTKSATLMLDTWIASGRRSRPYSKSDKYYNVAECCNGNGRCFNRRLMRGLN